MTKTKKNSVTFMKQAIKEMILQDSEVTKILLGNEENNYKNVKELLGKNIYKPHFHLQTLAELKIVHIFSMMPI